MFNMDDAKLIYLCSLQVACKGNEAVGVMEFDFDGEPLELPCCEDCAAWIDRAKDGVVE